MQPIDQPATKLTYRADIDGLRAVAVGLVVLNHLRTRFTGGYIGVDVFFVISGYLISAAILKEMNDGTFSTVRFYERRIRRIFPALFGMLLGVVVLAWRFDIPSEIENIGSSVLAAVFSVSNMLFWHQAGYFDAPSALKPLLHTWSLGVEEQFYIFFPLLLIALRRWMPTRLRSAIWIVAALSFAAACFVVRIDTTAAFFFAPLRAWELLAGTVLSQGYLPTVRGRVQRNVASAAGLLLILVPSLVYNAATPFPGLSATLPCLGAVLIISAGETGPSFVGFLLSLRPVVFLGLISYSLYLWHWPILVFQESRSLLLSARPGNPRAKAMVVLVSFVAATLSWRFIETPFRKGSLRPGKLLLFGQAAVVMLLFAGVGVYMLASHGMASRFPPNARAIADFSTFDPSIAFRQHLCFLGPPNQSYADFNPNVCLATDGASGVAHDPPRKQYLLLGDSHAAHLYPGLSTVFPEINLLQASVAGCKPFVTRAQLLGDDCARLRNFMFTQWLPNHRIDGVLLAARWELSDLPELHSTVTWFQQHGMPVTILGPTIEYDVPMPSVVAISLRDHDFEAIARHRTAEPEEIDREMIRTVRQQWRIPYISMYEDLCRSQVEVVAKSQPETARGCPIYAAPAVPLLFDEDHLTPQGSALYASAIRKSGQLSIR